MIQSPLKSMSVFLKFQLFSYSSNTNKSKNKRQTLQSLYRKVLPVLLCYFQDTYHHVHQIFNLKDHIYRWFFQFRASWLFQKSLAEVHGDRTGNYSDSTETRLNISNITIKNVYWIQLLIGLQFYWLHLNYNPNYTVALYIRRLPKVNPQITSFLFS